MSITNQIFIKEVEYNICKTIEKEVVVEVELKNDKNITMEEFCEWFSIKERILFKWIKRKAHTIYGD